MQPSELIYVDGWLKLLLSLVPPAEHQDHYHCCRCRRYSPAECCQEKSINQPIQRSHKNVNSAPLTRKAQSVFACCDRVCMWILIQEQAHCVFSFHFIQFQYECILDLFWNYYFKNKQFNIIFNMDAFSSDFTSQVFTCELFLSFYLITVKWRTYCYM